MASDLEQIARNQLEMAMGCAIEHNLSGQVSVAAAIDAIVAALRTTVPEAKILPELRLASYHEAIGWNACRDAMLRSAPAAAGVPDGALPAHVALAIATAWRRKATGGGPGRSTLIRCATDLEAAVAAKPQGDEPTGLPPIALPEVP